MTVEIAREIDRVLEPLSPRSLTRFGSKMYSQNLEDGMIAEIFRRIGEGKQSFLEVGSGDGQENNTLALLHCGWSGMWVDASPQICVAARKKCKALIDTGRLSVHEAKVNRESCPAPTTVDLFSLDIDGMDWHVLKGLMDRNFRPRAIVLEYNAKFPPPLRWKVAYDPSYTWDGTDYFGASLQAFCDILEPIGYYLAGCDVVGLNAFFVRGEELNKKPDEWSAAVHHRFYSELYMPPRYWLSQIKSGHGPRLRPYSMEEFA